MKTSFLKGVALASIIAFPVSSAFAQTAQTATSAQPAATAQTVDTAQPAPQEQVGTEAGYGVGAAVASVFYAPAKVMYAGLGLLTGGLGWVLSGGRSDVASSIIYPAITGNYVVTPNNLKGTEPLYFVGAPPPQPEPAQPPQVSSATR
jgi:ABC-type tungstate transport system substrate-binding protein